MSLEGLRAGSVGHGEIRFSVIIPVLGTTIGLADAIGDYGRELGSLEGPFEIVLVPGRPQTGECDQLVRTYDWARVRTAGGPGWGRSVRDGLELASGEILGYTNWKRTSAAVLLQMLRYASSSPELVLRANRRTRDTRVQRLGSLLFNLECRALLGITAWDVNGTPKVFPRNYTRLLALTREDDLLDAEFALVCEREGYQVAEIPVDAPPRPGHGAGVDYRNAVLMYLRVFGLRRGANAVA
jgi:hypothetical protein